MSDSLGASPDGDRALGPAALSPSVSTACAATIPSAWISVDEQVPEVGTECLVYIERLVMDVRLNGEDITLELATGNTPRELRETLGRGTAMVIDHLGTTAFGRRAIRITMDDGRKLYFTVSSDGKRVTWEATQLQTASPSASASAPLPA